LKSYRVYIVGSDGRLQLGEAFDAVDDAVAAARAEARSAGQHSVEIWQGGRLVGQVSKDGVFKTGDS
jgi:hypothetical protein